MPRVLALLEILNYWNGTTERNEPTRSNWQGVCYHPVEGTVYKYQIETMHNGIPLKADPYGVYAELRPKRPYRP